VRDVRTVWFDAAVRDLRQAFRSLARAPWYFATVVGVIALAMTLTTAVLAVVDGMLFKPLPYRQPDRLFAVSPAFASLPAADDNMPMGWHVSPLELNAWRAALPDVQLTAFSENYYQTRTLENASHPNVDATFFATLGISLQGSGFGAGDFVTAPVSPVIITHAVWQSQYGLDPAALGRTFTDSYGNARRIVGILPRDFVFPGAPRIVEAVRPLAITDPNSRSRNLTVLARLPSGVTALQAAERLTAATRRLAATWPRVPARPGATQRDRIWDGPFDVVRLDPLRDALATRSLQTARSR
jgi:putative ABC transport system permease protein